MNELKHVTFAAGMALAPIDAGRGGAIRLAGVR